jgi:hypothetical protein
MGRVFIRMNDGLHPMNLESIREKGGEAILHKKLRNFGRRRRGMNLELL